MATNCRNNTINNIARAAAAAAAATKIAKTTANVPKKPQFMPKRKHHVFPKYALKSFLMQEEKEVIYYRDKLPKWNATAREKGIKE